MKKTLVLLSFFSLFAWVCTANSDEKFVKAISTALTKLNEAQSPQEILAVANRFESIGKSSAKEWLPNYYSAYCYIRLSLMEKENTKRDKYVEKAEELIKTLPENDEVYVLKAFAANAYLVVDPQNRWLIYGANFEEFLGIAAKLNPENPRIYYLRGAMTYNTPEQFGGGVKMACPILQTAKTKYEAFQPDSKIAPIWGLDSTVELLKACQ